MVQRHRSRHALIADVLQATRKKSPTLTELLVLTAMPHSRLTRMLDELVAAGLIQRLDKYATTEGGERYTITGKGERWLRLYAKMSSLLRSQNEPRPRLDTALLEAAKKLTSQAKKDEAKSGTFRLEGRAPSILNAAAYCIVAERAGQRFTFGDASRLFGFSPNTVSRAKRLLESIGA